MALLEQIQYTRRKTTVFFPRCSKLIQSPKNSARISQIFSLRLSGSASLFFFPFLPQLLACLQRKSATPLHQKHDQLLLSLLMLRELARHLRDKKRPRIHCLDLAGKNRVHPPSPDLGTDILKHPQDNEIFRL